MDSNDPTRLTDPAEPAGLGNDGLRGEQPHEVAVEQPGKLMRIAMMVREMLEEVRRAPLDENAREHLADIHARVVNELKGALSGPLAEELERITLPFGPQEIPSEAELRIAHAQLLGWLEGLFQGIQAAIATQQLAMASQLEEMRRRALPAGEPGQPRPGEPNPGQYL
ncbi:MAG: proteasome activator [Actinomycetota bacterium]